MKFDLKLESAEVIRIMCCLDRENRKLNEIKDNNLEDEGFVMMLNEQIELNESIINKLKNE